MLHQTAEIARDLLTLGTHPSSNFGSTSYLRPTSIFASTKETVRVCFGRLKTIIVEVLQLYQCQALRGDEAKLFV